MKHRYLAAFLIAATVLPASAQFRSSRRFALTAGQVARSIAKNFSGQGIDITSDQVTLPANVVATDPDPIFDVGPMSIINAQGSGGNAESRSAVRVTCHVPGTCVPFYAIVRWQPGAAPLRAAAAAVVHEVVKAAVKSNPKFLILTGTHATLLLGGDAMQIEITVISLDNGVAGQRIRVAGTDRRQVYVAEVVGAGVLKGAL